MLITVMASAIRSEPDDHCWPQVHPDFPVGSPDAVIGKASDFLLRAEGAPSHPYWPGGSSGITIGVGWDIGYHTADELRKSWGELDADRLLRLETASGKRGPAAQALLGRLVSITVPRSMAVQVLNDSLKNDYLPLMTKLFPGVEKLPVEAQVVLISVVFNRGSGMGHDPDWLTAKQLDQRWDAEDARRCKT